MPPATLATLERFPPPHAALAAEAAAAKSGIDTVVMDMRESLGVADAFVITSARNARQVRTIVDEVEQRLARSPAGRPASVEGLGGASWVLMDYGDVVVHVFLEDAREYYDLEHLWARSPRVSLSSEGARPG